LLQNQVRRIRLIDLLISKGAGRNQGVAKAKHRRWPITMATSVA